MPHHRLPTAPGLLAGVACMLFAAAALGQEEGFPARLPALSVDEQVQPAQYAAPERYPLGPSLYSTAPALGDPYGRPAFDPPPPESPPPGAAYMTPPPGAVFAAPPGGGMADLQAHLGSSHLSPDAIEHRYRALPDGVLWKPYLASTKESRLSTTFIDVENDSTFLDSTLGGRFALFRIGNGDSFFPEGLEFDFEGSAQVRLDLPEDVDVHAVDFRAGGFFAWGDRWRQTKFGYYHLSSHVGDEFLIKRPGYQRLNYARDVLVLAQSIYVTEDLRVYGEIGWAFYTRESKEWEFQFGSEWAPSSPTGAQGAPFLAVHCHLREELNYSGNVVFQAGWAWVGDESRNMLRIGFHYYNGMSTQYSFYDRFEEQIGLGIWFDR